MEEEEENTRTHHTKERIKEEEAEPNVRIR